MNEGSDFNRPPDDEASDPLLAALRQRLGENFGQEPSPALWAGIRQRLPVAAPRPWWLRTRRLLPLLAVLAGLLLVGVITTRQPHQPAGTGPLAAGYPAGPPKPGQAASGQLAAPTLPARPASPSPASRPSSPGPGAASVATAASQPTARQPAADIPATGSASVRAAPAAGPAHSAAAFTPAPAAVSVASRRRSSPARLAAAYRAGHRPASTKLPADSFAGQASSAGASAEAERQLSLTATRRARPAQRRGAARASATGQGLLAESRTATAARFADAPATTDYPARHRAKLPTAATRAATRHRSRPALLAAGPAGARPHSGGHPGTATRHPSEHRPAARPGAAAPAVTLAGAVAAPAAPAPVDSLARRRASLGRLAAGQLPASVARPDSTWPWLPPVRRWSVLVVAGPTLSYRTLGSAPGSSPTTTVPNNSFFYGSQNNSTSALERPAAGLGAQVQLRRVLTGRWALALGLGYQEYATRLALRVASYNPTYPLLPNLDTVRVVHQRDTYRLLTLPVQLSYALGPPRGRLALGVLAGFEPGLYVGGRTTENSGCSCQQQAFSSAIGSPYSQVNVALSLGLDVRYRLGGPAGRWQLLVQPTGRYVATPFVRSMALGYARRQPYSLGLLTGFSWDLR